MPNRTQLIYADDAGDIPATYKLPPSLDLILESVVASWDGSGASGAFLPCLGLYSQDDKLMGRFHPGTQVEAGDSATVTYAPFLRGTAGAAEILFDHFYAFAQGAGVIPSGAVTALAVASAGNDGTDIAFQRESSGAFRIRTFDGPFTGGFAPAYFYTAELRVSWPAFAGDRYVELTSLAPVTDYTAQPLPVIQRNAGTPDGDEQSVSAVLIPTAGGAVWRTLVPRVFQASGIAQVLNSWTLSVTAHGTIGVS